MRHLLIALFLLAPLHAAKPNFIIIYTDDQGYGDLGCFGSETIDTPHIDRLAKEGRRFTSFYVASSVCTPSRAALLTGSYPKRVDLQRGVIFPPNKYGLHPEHTTTIADEIKDPDPKNAYINTIEHIDAEVGRLVDTLRELKLEETTVLIFTSDNGPWLPFKHHGGPPAPCAKARARPSRGDSAFPALPWVPGRIPASSESDAFATTMDLLPTFAGLAGADLPDARIDGFDLGETFTGDADSPRSEMLFYTANGDLDGIRQGDWKLLLKGKRKQEEEPKLFNLAKDLGETTNLAAEHPERVEALTRRMQELDAEVTANAVPVWGKR